MPSWLLGTLPSPERQLVALPGEHPVAETFRQIEQAVGVGHEGAVAAVPPWAAAVPAKSSVKAPVKATEAAVAALPARTCRRVARCRDVDDMRQLPVGGQVK